MKKIWKIIAVNSALIAAVLIVAELIFGSWIFGPDYGVLNIPRNTVRYFDISGLYPANDLATYTRDRYGLRGKYDKPGDIDVLVMGGSTTNEIYVGDGKTWVDRLSEKFAETGNPLTIVNAAIDGQSTRGHIRAMDLWFPNIPELKPRYVLVYVGINDLAVQETGLTQYDEMKSPSPVRRFRHYLMNHSVIYNRFRQIRGMFVAQRTRLVHGAYKTVEMEWRPVRETTGKEESAKETLKVKAYTGRLRALARKIRKELGSEPIFITQRRGDYKFVGGRLLVRVKKT